MRAKTPTGKAIRIKRISFKNKNWRVDAAREVRKEMYDVACEQCGQRTENCECSPGFPDGVVDPDTVYGLRWRKLPMARDDAEMTSCGRGTIRRKPGTSSVWKVRVRMSGQSYSSYSGFTKSIAKKWVEDKINEKTII